MPMHRTLNQDFFKTWSPGMAYVLGYFAADGSMINNVRGGQYIEFTSTDRVLLEIVKSSARSHHSISVRSTKPNDQTQYRIQIGSNQWFADLTKLGFTPKKSITLKMPSVPTLYMHDFVRGYFDGDGCIYVNRIKFADRKHKRLIVMSLFTSGSKGFLLDLLRVLRGQGIQGGSLVRKQRGYELKFSLNDSIALYRFMYNTKPVLAYLPRKRAKFEQAMRLLGVSMRT